MSPRMRAEETSPGREPWDQERACPQPAERAKEIALGASPGIGFSIAHRSVHGPGLTPVRYPQVTAVDVIKLG